ncbi:putative Tad-like Flp pilus-assembly [Bordetella pertussis STO1-CHOC-0017]|nr:putative Tad-like Flp pilus-assembly [Bordetella pertussis STO1-CHOC-0017]
MVRRLRARRRQRGSILIPAALAILIGVALLGAAQLGYFFYMKRELQKTADLAALTGVQVLSPGDEAACAAAGQAVRASVRANLGSRADDGLSIEPTCWRWARDEAELAPRYVREPADPSERYNAVAVVLGMPVRALFPFLGGRTLEVEAIAARPADPIAAFSVGTGLLATGSGELTRLLKQVGLDIGGTAVLGYDIGLAGVKITPAGLLDALGIAVPTDISVAGLNQLLSANVSALDGVLDAVVRAASRDSLLDANVGLVQAIETAVGVKDLAVRLGSETAERAGGLFANIQAPDAASALNVELDALEVLATAIGVGTSGHAIACGVAVPLLMSGPARCSVVEPPSIAIGGVGATAYTSQIRVHAPLRLDTGSLLGGLVRLDLDIPLTVDVVNGHGTIEALCHARDAAGRDLAVVSTRSSLLKICLGGPPAGLTGPELANWPFSTTASCDENLTRKRLLGLELNLLGKRVNLASLNPDPPLVVPALQTTSEDDYYAGQRRSQPRPAAGRPGAADHQRRRLLRGPAPFAGQRTGAGRYGEGPGRCLAGRADRQLPAGRRGPGRRRPGRIAQGPGRQDLGRHRRRGGRLYARGVRQGRLRLPACPLVARHREHRELFERPDRFPGRAERQHAGPAGQPGDAGRGGIAGQRGRPGRQPGRSAGRHPGRHPGRAVSHQPVRDLVAAGRLPGQRGGLRQRVGQGPGQQHAAFRRQSPQRDRRVAGLSAQAAGRHPQHDRRRPAAAPHRKRAGPAPGRDRCAHDVDRLRWQRSTACLLIRLSGGTHERPGTGLRRCRCVCLGRHFGHRLSRRARPGRL